MSLTEITCAHSPDSDDAFMFYGLATKKVRSNTLTFRHVLDDIESLNKKATTGQYELTAISYHAYPYVADKYVLLSSGSSVGDGYGPMVVSTKQHVAGRAQRQKNRYSRHHDDCLSDP